MGLDLEIVRVVSEQTLIDSESYQRHYATRDGRPLERAFYVVIQERRAGGPRYDAQADYVGPFRDLNDATRELQSHH